GGRLAMDGVEEREPVHAFHAQVRDDEIGRRDRHGGERRLAGLRGRDRVARGAEAHRDEVEQILVVVDEEDLLGGLLFHRYYLALVCMRSSRSRISRSIAFSASSCFLSVSSRRAAARTMRWRSATSAAICAFILSIIGRQSVTGTCAAGSCSVPPADTGCLAGSVAAQPATSAVTATRGAFRRPPAAPRAAAAA